MCAAAWCARQPLAPLPRRAPRSGWREGPALPAALLPGGARPAAPLPRSVRHQPVPRPFGGGWGLGGSGGLCREWTPPAAQPRPTLQPKSAPPQPSAPPSAGCTPGGTPDGQPWWAGPRSAPSLHVCAAQEGAEELFEVLACYFPVTFTPPPNDPNRWGGAHVRPGAPPPRCGSAWGSKPLHAAVDRPGA